MGVLLRSMGAQSQQKTPKILGKWAGCASMITKNSPCWRTQQCARHYTDSGTSPSIPNESTRSGLAPSLLVIVIVLHIPTCPVIRCTKMQPLPASLVVACTEILHTLAHGVIKIHLNALKSTIWCYRVHPRCGNFQYFQGSRHWRQGATSLNKRPFRFKEDAWRPLLLAQCLNTKITSHQSFGILAWKCYVFLYIKSIPEFTM